MTKTNLAFSTQSHGKQIAGDFSDYSCLQESVDNLTCKLPFDFTVKKGAERGMRDDKEEKGQARLGEEHSLTPMALGQSLEASRWAQGIF